jgi:beta-lactamase class C
MINLKKALRLSPLLLSLCASLPGMATASPAPDIDTVVQDAAQAVMRQYHIAGMSIAVTAHGQQRFYNYGLASRASGQPVSSDTLFELGSISKTFTATLATYAQASGHLSLNDHPGKYLPALQGSAFDRVSLMHLGTHTAGGFPLQVPDEVQNTAQLMDYLKHWQPQYAAGSKRTYANPSIGMLGMITATSMGLPYEQALEQQLFPRLGLTASYLTVPAEKLPLYAQGYDKQDAPVRLNPGVLANEAYGVKSSARDLLHFVEANLGLTQPEPAIKRALSDTHTGYYQLGQSGQLGAMTQDLIWEQYAWPVKLETLVAGNSNTMAYETQAVTPLTPPLPPQLAVWINKTGSTNGFGGYVAFVPQKNIGIVILANKNYPNEARVKLAYGILSGL